MVVGRHTSFAFIIIDGLSSQPLFQNVHHLPSHVQQEDRHAQECHGVMVYAQQWRGGVMK